MLFNVAINTKENKQFVAVDGQDTAPEIAKPQTSIISKQCSAHTIQSDFPWLIFLAVLMISGGQKSPGKSVGAVWLTGRY